MLTPSPTTSRAEHNDFSQRPHPARTIHYGHEGVVIYPEHGAESQSYARPCSLDGHRKHKGDDKGIDQLCTVVGKNLRHADAGKMSKYDRKRKKYGDDGRDHDGFSEFERATQRSNMTESVVLSSGREGVVLGSGTAHALFSIHLNIGRENARTDAP